MASSSNDPGDDGEQSRHMRSGPSQVCSYVRFINTTQRVIDIIWLNYEGIGVVYRTLRPRQYVHVNTFVGHPWIFQDSVTGDRMCVQTRDVYEPTSSMNESGQSRRRLIYITNPLYTLRERCLQEIRRCVSPSQMNQLELPREVLRDLLVRQSDVPILASSVANQDRLSSRSTVSPLAGITSGYNVPSESSSSARAGVPSSSRLASRHGASSMLGSTSSSSSEMLSPSRFQSDLGTASSSGFHSNSCTSSQQLADRESAQRCDSGILLSDNRQCLAAADSAENSQLINNNNNNDQAMDWNCNNNSSSAINQNIQPSTEVSSSQNGRTLYQCHDGAAGSSTVSSSSSHRSVSSLRDRLLYQYLECSSGNDIVSSQVMEDNNWSNDCAVMYETLSCSCQVLDQNVVDSSSSLNMPASCSNANGTQMPDTSNPGQVSGHSSTCTVTSSSEVDSLAVSPSVPSPLSQSGDDAGYLNGTGVVPNAVPASSSTDHQQVACRVSSPGSDSEQQHSSRFPSSSLDAQNNIDSSPASVENLLGPCHSNSDPEQYNLQNDVSSFAGCQNSDSINVIPDSDYLANEPNTDPHNLDEVEGEGSARLGMEPVHSQVNSTSDEGGKHSLARVDESRLPFKKHRP